MCVRYTALFPLNFSRECDTILGEVAEDLELFLVDDCQDTQLTFCVDKVKVLYKG